jgi:hypothetical protein
MMYGAVSLSKRVMVEVLMTRAVTLCARGDGFREKGIQERDTPPLFYPHDIRTRPNNRRTMIKVGI